MRRSCDPKDLFVGVELFVEIRQNRHGAVTKLVPDRVTKIGRKWVDLDNNGRFSCEDMQLDGRGFSSPGTVWFSRDEWEQASVRHNEWSDMVRRLTHTPPDHLTLADIREIAAKLLSAKKTG